MPGDPFTIESPPDAPLGRVVHTAARPFLDWLLQLGIYRALYQQASSLAGPSFASRALQALDIAVDCSPADLSHVPAKGPLIVAANHPHGALDGLALLALLERRRPDIRLLANHWVARIPELREICFFVDPFGGPRAASRSLAGLREAHLWLRQGGALIIFPAGEVAHRRRADGSIAESEWKPTVGRLAMAGSPVVPTYIEGRNSQLFYRAGRAHPALRTVLLARELLGKRGSRVQVRLGSVIAPDPTDEQDREPATFTRRLRQGVENAPMAAEIQRLPASACLVESGPFRVFCAPAVQIPRTLREIGRLREITFREIGEGTGRALDLDVFDDHYLHLFSWNRERQEVVGAYRIQQPTRSCRPAASRACATRTLFHYQREFLDAIAPALELGRSFVRAESQKDITQRSYCCGRASAGSSAHTRSIATSSEPSASARATRTRHGHCSFGSSSRITSTPISRRSSKRQMEFGRSRTARMRLAKRSRACRSCCVSI